MDKAKYFLAIVVPPPFQQELMELKQYVFTNFASKAALRSPAHITLHMPFEWNADKEDRLIKTLEEFRFKKSFSVTLRNFSCFAPRVVFVDVTANELLNELQKEIVRFMMHNFHLMNEATNMRGFHPHVTIAFRDLNKERFNQAWDHFKNQAYDASFKADSFHLLKHSPGKWEVHKTFPLG
jgi:2'-5' RNA ligase